MLKLGDTTVGKLHMGDAEVAKLYHGDDLIYEMSGGVITPYSFVASGASTAATGSISGVVDAGILIIAANDEVSSIPWTAPLVNGVAATSLGQSVSTDGAGSSSELFYYPLASHAGVLNITNLTIGGPAYHFGLFDGVGALLDIDPNTYTGDEYVATEGVIGGTVGTAANGLVFLMASHGGSGTLAGSGAGTIMETVNPSSVVMGTSHGAGTGAALTVEQGFSVSRNFRASTIAASFQTI